MCQYQATAHDGVPTDWHTAHWAQMAMSGAASSGSRPRACRLKAASAQPAWACGTTPRPKPSPGTCPGPQAQRRRHRHPALGHAGRKAGCNLPWLGAAQLGLDEGGWVTRAFQHPPTSPMSANPWR